MSVPSSAPVADEVIDPSDIVDFVIDLSLLLEQDEAFETIDFAVAAESVLLGLTILDTAPHAPAEIGNNQVRIWVTVDEAYHGNASWAGNGSICGIEFTVSTTTKRTFQRTVAIKVAEK